MASDGHEERDGEEQVEVREEGQGEEEEREVMVKVVEQGKKIMELT